MLPIKDVMSLSTAQGMLITFRIDQKLFFLIMLSRIASREGIFRMAINFDHQQFDKESKKFTVDSENLKTNEKSSEIFDNVIVATGHFTYPHDPHFEGQETFKGKIIHSHDFLDGKLFKKRVFL